MDSEKALDKLSKEELIEQLEELLLQKKQEDMARQIMQQKQEDIYRFYDRYKIVSKIAKEGLWELRVPEKFSPQTPVWYSEEFSGY